MADSRNYSTTKKHVPYALTSLLKNLLVKFAIEKVFIFLPSFLPKLNIAKKYNFVLMGKKLSF